MSIFSIGSAQNDDAWTSIVQNIEVNVFKETKFKISAACKVKTHKAKAMAGIWARVDNKNDDDGFFDNMLDRPIQSPEWKTYTLTGTLNKESKTLNFGGLVVGNGSFYFDDFNLFIENGNGDFEMISISNPSFEEGLANELPAGWVVGIDPSRPTNASPFKIKLKEEGLDGKFSIEIEYVAPPFYLPQVFPVKF